MDLSEKGVSEAKAAGKLLKAEGFSFDFAYTSVLKRAIHTLWNVLDELDQAWLPVEKSWKLNERHYGALQGLNKAETAEKYGDEQVKQWRRGFAVTPPELTKDDERYPGHDPRYAKLTDAELPTTESLALTIDRVVPYWNETILPRLKSGERVIIAAHGNSLRALVKYLDNMGEDEIRAIQLCDCYRHRIFQHHSVQHPERIGVTSYRCRSPDPYFGGSAGSCRSIHYRQACQLSL